MLLKFHHVTRYYYYYYMMPSASINFGELDPFISLLYRNIVHGKYIDTSLIIRRMNVIMCVPIAIVTLPSVGYLRRTSDMV